MYVREKPMHLNKSASYLINNLSVLVGNTCTIFGVVHQSSVMLCIVSSGVDHRQVMCKEPGGQRLTITMAKLLRCAGRDLLVITTTRGMQIYDANKADLMDWYSLREKKSRSGRGAVGGAGDPDGGDLDAESMCGIATVGNNVLCIGTCLGQICVFSVTAKRANFSVALTSQVDGHKCAITCMDSRDEWLASGDENGGVRLWQLMDNKLVSKGAIKEAADRRSRWPVNGLRLTPSAAAVIVGYGSGLLRVFDVRTGALQAEASAHGRMITGMDLVDEWLVTVSEDTMCRLWQLRRQPDGGHKLEHVYAEAVSDQMLVGCHFLGAGSDRFCLTAYENDNLIMMRRK